jgi:hypothetical protein
VKVWEIVNIIFCAKGSAIFRMIGSMIDEKIQSLIIGAIRAKIWSIEILIFGNIFQIITNISVPISPIS